MLNTEPNLAAPDDVYEMLVEAHRDLTPAESRGVNAKLILLLANHIGDAGILADAIARARAGLGPAAREPGPDKT